MCFSFFKQREKMTTDERRYILDCILTIHNLINNDKKKSEPSTKINIGDLETFVIYDDVKFRSRQYVGALVTILYYNYKIFDTSEILPILPSFYFRNNLYEFKNNDFYVNNELQIDRHFYARI